jgi:hypothetical protein
VTFLGEVITKLLVPLFFKKEMILFWKGGGKEGLETKI